MISSRLFKSKRGFTLMEILMALVIIGIIGVVGALSFGDIEQRDRYERTRQQMEALRAAILGDTQVSSQGRRGSFGYAGDWGSLPASLSNLTTSQTPAWAFSSTYGFGVGWKSTYLSTSFGAATPTTDAWGNAFVWSTAADPATITSYGSDEAAGTVAGQIYSRDIIVEIANSAWKGTVRGRLLRATRAMGSATVVIRYPSAGSMTSASDTTDSSGNFDFANIPFGVRSLEVTSSPTLAPRQITVDIADYEVPTEKLNYFGSEVNLTAVCCRLTTDSSNAVTTNDQASQRHIYLVPYKGNIMPLFDGQKWQNYRVASAGVDLDLQAPSIATNTNFDIFLYDNGGTLTLEATTWTDDTTRATSLATFDGILVKSTDYTRRYVGSGRTVANNRTEDSVTNRYVWNYYNRVKRTLLLLDTTTSWTYNTAAWRCANNATGNHVDVMTGTSDAVVELTATVRSYNSGGALHYVGIDDRSSDATDCDGTPAHESNASVNGASKADDGEGERPVEAFLKHHPTPGHHVYQWVEMGASSGTTTFFGASNGGGIHGFVEG